MSNGMLGLVVGAVVVVVVIQLVVIASISCLALHSRRGPPGRTPVEFLVFFTMEQYVCTPEQHVVLRSGTFYYGAVILHY